MENYIVRMEKQKRNNDNVQAELHSDDQVKTEKFKEK